jgi:hypothetical protein
MGGLRSAEMTSIPPAAPKGAPAAKRWRSVRRAATITAAVGALHALLFLVAWLLMSDVPGPEATNAEIADFYGSGRSRRVVLVGLYLMPLAGIAFVWFIVALRMWIAVSTRRRDALLSNIQLVSGILYVALFCASSAAVAVLAASVEFADADTDPIIARQFPVYGSSLLFVFAFRMVAMFVFTTSTILRAAGILPRWFAWSGYAVGLFLLLSASFEGWFALVFPAWLLVLSAILMRRARQIPADLTLPASGRQSRLFAH